ncbi:MAG: hypothetical protein WBM54_13050 [Woeseia sp.]
MFKALRITVLLILLIFVAGTSWLAQARSTDWNDSLWVKIYPINGDGSSASERYIENLDVGYFAGIEKFLAREVTRYGHTLKRPVRVELGSMIKEQPPAMPDSFSRLAVMMWSLRMRWWAHSIASPQDSPAPDVRIFVRYFEARDGMRLENSVGLQKGMVGLVNAYTGRRQIGSNNVIIAHEFLHTLGATDKYDPATGVPRFPEGFAEPLRAPLYPQKLAELMGGRIPVAEDDAVIPASLDYAVIGPETAAEIGLVR